MTLQPLTSWNRVLTTLVLWSVVTALILTVDMPVWLLATILVVSATVSTIIWKWQQAQMFFNTTYLSEQLGMLSDDELQETHEGIAELKAIFEQHEGSKIVDSLVTQLNENQLLLMKEQLNRADVLDETTEPTPATQRLRQPIIQSHTPKIQAGMSESDI